jgi:hypothetical protein
VLVVVVFEGLAGHMWSEGVMGIRKVGEGESHGGLLLKVKPDRAAGRDRKTAKGRQDFTL